MTARNTGWKAVRRRFLGKLRSVLPTYKVILLLSILFTFASFLLRNAKLFIRPRTMRFFRGALVDFLSHAERQSASDMEIFLDRLMGWEDSMPAADAVKLIEQNIDLLRSDCRIADLYFFLAAAYYLSGDFPNYQSSYLRGLEELKNLRTNGPLNGMGSKFLFTEDWGWGIGHISCLDPLVKLRQLNLLSSHERILVLSPEDGANKHYLAYWKKHFNFLIVSRHEARQLISTLRPATEKLSGFELKSGFSMIYEAWNLAGDAWSRENRQPLLQLDRIDFDKGWEVLQKWGLPPGSWFVGLHVRELNHYAANHNRLRAAPNADIRTYLPAIESIIAKGGWVIRMGDPSMSEMPKMRGLIDYANSEARRDWMDVFLWASCKFFIGTSSGPLTVPPTFGVPVLYTNCCGIGHSPALGKALMIPKLFLERDKKRLLTFEQILARPIGWSVRIPEDDNIEIIDNSPDEIEMAANDMFALLDTSRASAFELSETQKQFEFLRRKYGNHASTPIAESFARKHCDLLATSSSAHS